MIKSVFLNVVFLALAFTVTAQSTGPVSINKAKSSMSFTGTSTLHDWEIVVNEFDGFAEISGAEPQLDIAKGKLNIKVKSFKSHKSSMDNVVFDAMKADKYPNIVFDYLKTVKSEVKNGKAFITAKGNLTIAGTTREIQLEMTGTQMGTSYQMSGVKSFKMSEFNIEPPSFMFGTVKSGDEIKIKYSINFQIN